MGMSNQSRKRDRVLYGQERKEARLFAIINCVIAITLLCACLAAYMAHY